MRVAVLSDIHGNWPALEAVLKDFERIDSCICCGDVVGYYPFANEVCAGLKRIGTWVVRGNHDAFVIGELSPVSDKSIAYRVEWTREHLFREHFLWLESLPVELSFKWGTLTIRVRHANPWDEDTYLYPDTDLLQTISLSTNTYLFLGHTHYPMKVRCGKGFVVNPGSVGQPRDWDSRPSYAVLDTLTGQLQFRRVKYDVQKLQDCLKRMGWEQTSIDILGRQRPKNVE